MKYTIEINGVEVSFKDAASAADVLKEMGKKTAKPAAIISSGSLRTKSVVRRTDHLDVEIAEKAIRFLKRLSETSGALRTDQIMSSLGVKSANAVGGTTKKINSLLVDLGFNKESVYTNPKKPKQQRTWYRGKDIEAAIEAIDQKLMDQLV